MGNAVAQQPHNPESFLHLLWNKTGCSLGCRKSFFSYLHSLESPKGHTWEKKTTVQAPWHIADSVAVTNLYTVTTVELPRLTYLTILVCREAGQTRNKHKSCLREKNAVPAPEKLNYPMSLTSRRVRWRPAVTDGHLLKGGFKWGYTPCWQGSATLILNMCVL